mgnify:CR=1 FL=1
MKILKSISIWFFGFISGAILIFLIKTNSPNTIKISVKNNSSFIVKELFIQELRLKYSNFIQNISPNDSINIEIIANGVMQYRISALLENGIKLKNEVYYSESGYNDIFTVLNDIILYKTKVY